MKPTRGLPHSWLGSLSKERRMALLSIALLLMLLGALVLYQQFRTPAEPLRPAPVAPIEQPPQTAEGVPVQGPGTSDSSLAAPAKVEVAPTKLAHPLAGDPRIVKLYGSLDEAYGDFRLYTGMAYGVQSGQSVLAVADGTVTAVEEDPAEGRALVLDLGGGMTTRYAGLGKVLVATGARVQAGSIIAQVGEPGPARVEMGPHLALEVLLEGSPVDPTTYLAD